jgi:hypothetical protein
MFRLGADERRLAARALLLLLMVRALLMRVSVPRLRRLCRSLAASTAVGPARTGELVEAAGGLLGVACLARSIVLEALLAASGHDAVLRIGLAPRGGRGTVAAHAWVELAGSPLGAPGLHQPVPVFGLAA